MIVYPDNYFATFDERQAEVARSVSFSTNL